VRRLTTGSHAPRNGPPEGDAQSWINGDSSI
jgi:hypothetical protein